MSRIRSRDTGPELALRRALFGLGLRYRLYRRELPGTPDIVFVGARLAVQVRGCFWHQHPGCRQARIPLSRRDYWKPKLERNVLRDERNDAAIRKLGWRLRIVWECELKSPEMVCSAARSIRRSLVRSAPDRLDDVPGLVTGP
jgi:DNA mismatch endonuclease Vsr